ncbi:MAG: macro domain-containing protein [Planctomycetes bacterium]|nr:macro domain-containing protein [Planctomycetota bacterium]MCB9910253.1 macro domain-containing protein [Planctomycetota bacterium]HRV80948.1 macro domain-containing protein [Planctomycetota bacterium]
MLKEVAGDILLSNAQVIAHGVAPGDHFDSGLALGLREKYPTMAKDFRHYCKVGNPSPGGTWTWGGPEGVRIACLMTQEPAHNEGAKPGPATSHNVSKALRDFAKEAKSEGYTSIALPRLATGYGQMKWEEVRPLIEQHLGGLGIPILVYSEYHAGVKADEGLAKV